MIVEGGWSSVDAAAFSGTSPHEQADYFRRFAAYWIVPIGAAWAMVLLC